MADERDAAPAGEPLPRYARRALPAQRYLPGRTRRPRAPEPDAGFGAAAASFDPGAPWACEDFLHGADLWNHRFFWEAHEAWEEPWRAAGRATPVGRFLQGLILLAAAALKHELGAHEPARRLAARGARRMRVTARVGPPFDAPAFAAAVEAWVGGSGRPPPRLRLQPPAGS